MAGIVMYPFDTVKNDDQYLSIGWISLQEDIKASHCCERQVPFQCSGKQLSATGVNIGAMAIFLMDINLQVPYGCPGSFSSCQYLHVYSLVKTWIICAYAICDA
ncbi:hypothetical protein K492DRAFT_23994 [Lichtheimia hyalospora FSU 10163]|nr:hypothetical protein K492DRAFT_23994 [Lichtheimia hyalospora FSU 10163]